MAFASVVLVHSEKLSAMPPGMPGVVDDPVMLTVLPTNTFIGTSTTPVAAHQRARLYTIRDRGVRVAIWEHVFEDLARMVTWKHTATYYQGHLVKEEDAKQG
jgi:hypothetical protein